MNGTPSRNADIDREEKPIEETDYFSNFEEGDETLQDQSWQTDLLDYTCKFAGDPGQHRVTVRKVHGNLYMSADIWVQVVVTPKNPKVHAIRLVNAGSDFVIRVYDSSAELFSERDFVYTASPGKYITRIVVDLNDSHRSDGQDDAAKGWVSSITFEPISCWHF